MKTVMVQIWSGIEGDSISVSLHLDEADRLEFIDDQKGVVPAEPLPAPSGVFETEVKDDIYDEIRKSPSGLWYSSVIFTRD